MPFKGKMLKTFPPKGEGLYPTVSKSKIRWKFQEIFLWVSVSKELMLEIIIEMLYEENYLSGGRMVNQGTTVIGYVNPNGQVVLEKTDKDGSDLYQKISALSG
jgi:hypothetical protein